MTRYCKSCGSVSKNKIPLHPLYCSIFGKISVFVILHCTDIIIPTDTPDHFTPLRACAARGNNDIVCFSLASQTLLLRV